MNKYIKKLKENKFATSVITLTSGIIVAQAINFVGMPFIGRIYNPDAIGDYTLITANASVIMAVACLGMMTAFMLPKEDEEARGLCRLVSLSTASIAALIVAGLLLFSDLFKIFSTEVASYELSMFILWLYIVSHTINNICYAYINRKKLYKVMFWNPIIGASANVLLGILFGLAGWGFIGYTMAHILGYVFNTIHLIRYANPFIKVHNEKYKLFSLLKSYIRFPKYQMPANLIDTFSQQIPLQILGLVFGGTTLGLYSMCMRILSLPSILLASPINRVYYKEANDMYINGKDIGEFTFNILKKNIIIAILPVVILTIFGEIIFAVFLGEQWREAGQFASILALRELINFCRACLSGGPTILGKNKVNLQLSFLRLAMNVITFIIIITTVQSPIVAIWIITITTVIYVSISLGVFLSMAKVSLFRYMKFLSIYILLPFLCANVVKSLLW